VSQTDGRQTARVRALGATRLFAAGWTALDLGALAGMAGRAFSAALHEERERGRSFLWLPVAAIAGVLLFFAADHDPSLWASLAAFAALSGLAFAMRARPWAFPVAAMAAMVAAGFLSSALRVERTTEPVLQRALRGEAVGVVERTEPRGRGNTRILLRVETLGPLGAGERPRYVRASVPKARDVQAGARIGIEALWRPPPQAARPGGYDFARDAFFLGLGAVGSNAGPPRVLEPPALTWGRRFSAATDRLRNAITRRIIAAVPGDSGAIAAALVTGQRGEISAAANDALRVAGLYHVISISGLHMALFGGALFGVLRFVLILIPGVGLTRPVKKWAAVAALLGAGGYLYLSGIEVAAQRSFVMIAVVFLAVIADRQGVTMRNMALAAFCTLILAPEAVLGPSFQMSFGAVMGLVAWYERARNSPVDEGREVRRGGLVRFVLLYFGGIFITTVIATFATAPFATFHFQRIAVHSLPGNLIALPLVGILVMPFALIGFLLMPFGLDAPAWRVMGFGIDLMVGIATWISHWPWATASVPAFSVTAVLLMAFGLCWIAIWTTRLRLLGLVPVALGLAVAAFPERPDIYIEPGARAAAARGPDGTLGITGVRFASFAAQTWLAADGDPRKPRDKSVVAAARCDSFGCTLPLRGGGFLALDWTYAALSEDCGRARIVVTRLLAPQSCRAASTVIDGADLARDGAVALKENPDGTFTATARGASHRVWHGTPVPPDGPAFAAAEVKTPDAPSDTVEDGAADEDEDARVPADEAP
jgi:competence protein ComEC